MTPWKRGALARVVRPLMPALVLAIALAGLVWAMQSERSLMGPVGLLLGSWMVMGAAIDLWSRTGRGGASARLSRLRRLPGADWGKAVAHGGLGVTMFGIAGLMAWEVEDIRVVEIGERFPVGQFEIVLEEVRDVEGPNFLSTTGTVRVFQGAQEVTVLYPEKRIYPVARMPTTEAAIDYRFLRDIYVVLGDPQDSGGFTVRSYVKPLTNWIWAGCILMALGGLLSLFDRRYRVASGARKAPAQGTPAE